jgi:hypothetical protein
MEDQRTLPGRTLRPTYFISPVTLMYSDEKPYIDTTMQSNKIPNPYMSLHNIYVLKKNRWVSNIWKNNGWPNYR